MACGQVCQCTGSLQLRALRLGFLQDGNVGVGVFPEGEEAPQILRDLRTGSLWRRSCIVQEHDVRFDMGAHDA